MSTGSRRLTATILAATLSGIELPAPALAAAYPLGANIIPYDHSKINRNKTGRQRFGNGVRNSTLTSINSITAPKGVQNLIIGNTGGKTFDQVGFCKKRHTCIISQKIRY
jgi:hypothetical protein